MKKLTRTEFINKCNLVHDNYYSYDKTIYIKSSHLVLITCPIHGDFEQVAIVHSSGSGCHKCGFSKISKKRSMTTEKFLEKSFSLHGNTYSYEKVPDDIMSNKEYVILNCSIHGEFKITVDSHLRGCGCYYCGRTKVSNKLRSTTDEFIKSALVVHKNTYTYENVKYEKNCIAVDITCPTHGSFFQKPSSHLSGKGCPNCRSSNGEIKISNILDEYKILYNKQYIFEKCIDKSHLPFDFFIPFYNLCIEFDGRQHYEVVEPWGGINGLLDRQHKDKIKTKFCKDSNINLLRIKYDDDIEELLTFIIKEILDEFQPS